MVTPAFREMLVVLRNIVGKPEGNGDWPDPHGYKEDFDRARAAIVLAERELSGDTIRACDKIVHDGMMGLAGDNAVVGLTNCDMVDDDMAI